MNYAVLPWLLSHLPAVVRRLKASTDDRLGEIQVGFRIGWESWIRRTELVK